MEFLRELLNTNEAFVPDFDDMTDAQLIDLCAELEMEDSCELDDDGRIMNRDMVIADLKAGHGEADFDTPPRDEPMESPDDEMIRRPTPAVTSLESVTEGKKKLDPVGKEDRDVNNDGKVDKSDAYLARRRKARAKAIKEVEVIKHRGKKMTNTRKDFNFYKPIKEGKKLPSPAYGGKQKDVTNNSKVVTDKIGNAGMKGMKKKDRPYMEKPRFRDWIGGNMFWTMTKSGDLAGTMKLGEAADSAFQIYGVHVPANVYDGKYYDFRTVRIPVAASTAEEAIELVNSNKEAVLDNIDKKRMRVGQRSIRYVGRPTERNVFFKDDYSVRPIRYAPNSSPMVLTRQGFKKVSYVGEALDSKKDVNEKWNKEVEVAPSEKGKHSHKSLEELRSQLASAKEAGNTDLIRELNFAIRAKTGWGKVKK